MADTDNKLDPFTVIDDVHWNVGGAVEFDATAALYQSASGIADSYKMMCSTWIWVTSADPVTVLDFAEISNFNSGVGVASGLQFTTNSQHNVATGDDGLGDNITGDGSFTFYGTAFPTGRWVSLIYGVDQSTSTVYTSANPNAPTFNAPTCNVLVDGAGALDLSHDPQVIYLIKDGITFWEAGEPHLVGEILTINNWQIATSGNPFGLPLTLPDLGGNPKIRYGETQIWFGQYDLSRLDLFISGGHPAKLTKAQKAAGVLSPAAAVYGKPDIYFKGNKDQFPTNKGSGGAFAKVGNITTFKPAP